MGKPIPHGKEYFIGILLRNGWKISHIARSEHCSRMTVRAIRNGRTVHRKPPPDEIDGPDSCDPYVCEGCSEEAGYRVLVSFRPCVACDARAAREPEVANIAKG